jgi:protease I
VDELEVGEFVVLPFTVACGHCTNCEPMAAIRHGPWYLVEADVARGRRVTSWPSVRTDLRNAGATVVDEVVVTDGTITTSRSPDDLPAFCARIVTEFARAPRSAGAGSGT